jgi:hypothetical protein
MITRLEISGDETATGHEGAFDELPEPVLYDLSPDAASSLAGPYSHRAWQAAGLDGRNNLVGQRHGRQRPGASW